mmetsp:Transcript_31089/g.68256  ORF Transcript_31089/g.68256 Transcript_31089/m.68256 type:complete len:833 (+) Transcript_31089:362-2860(+)
MIQKQRNAVGHWKVKLRVTILLSSLLISLLSSIPTALADCPEYDGVGASSGGCTAVKTYAEFKAAVKDAQKIKGTNLVFCPFSITKEEDESPVLLYGDIQLTCRYKNFCYISGEGSHVILYGAKTKATIVGFVFRFATTSALRVWSNTPLQQNICHCHFTSNESEINGGAIRTENGSNVCIEDSRFKRNEAGTIGGGIYSKGELQLINTVFEENRANLGGAIASSAAGNSFVTVRDCEFTDNMARSNGPAIYIQASNGDKSEKFSFEGEIQASGNEIRMTTLPVLGMGNLARGKCNGAYDDGINLCVNFNTGEATKTPIEVDTLPDVVPNSTPVRPPSSAPVVAPTPASPTAAPPTRVRPTNAPPTPVPPSPRPSRSPVTEDPTSSPSERPTTKQPTKRPTKQPTKKPTPSPTPRPTPSPTERPSKRPTHRPTQRPTEPQIIVDSVEPDKPLAGYFNYNPDSKYGPKKWPNIRADKTSEYKYWKKYEDRINPPLTNNYCNWKNGNNANKQSPLDLVDTGAECLEYHEIRHKPGDFLLTDAEVKLEIHPNKMRILWPERINNRQEPDTPSADIPKGWGSQIDAIHTDLVIPSEHTMDGKRYDGEWRIHHIHPGGKGTAIITALIEAGHEKNRPFQKALDAWEELFDYHRYQCLFSRRQRRTQSTILNSDPTAGSMLNITSFDEFRRSRRMQQGDGFKPLFDHGDLTDPLTSKGRFDPYHQDIITSIFFYGYFGSLTEPPCYPIATWRVIDKPMLISDLQLNQMKRLLFEHVDENCRYTSNHYQESVARPIQKNIKRDIHKCTCRDYLSDAERKATGKYICDRLPVKVDSNQKD